MLLSVILGRRRPPCSHRWLSTTGTGRSTNETTATMRTKLQDIKSPAAFRKEVPRVNNVWTPPCLTNAGRNIPRLQLAASLVNPEATDGVDWLSAPDTMLVDQATRAHRTTMAQVRFEDVLRRKGDTMPKWTDVLAKMRKLTPQRTHNFRRDCLKILVSTPHAEKLATDVDLNIFEVAMRARVHIRVYRPEKGYDEVPGGGGGTGDGEGGGLVKTYTVVLSGDNVGLRKATVMLKRVDPWAVVIERGEEEPDESFLPSSSRLASPLSASCESGPVKGWPHDLRTIAWPLKGRRLRGRFEDIPKPAEWTQFSFASYICDLLRTRIYPFSATQYYGSLQAALEVKMVLLTNAFRDIRGPGCQSVKAYTNAIQYIQDQGIIFRPHARRLFAQMQNMKLRPDTFLFNKFFGGAAKQRDLYSFNMMLDFMKSHGCEPDFETWRIFASIFTNEPTKLDIIRDMFDIGLLDDPRAPRDMAKELVPYDTFRAVQKLVSHHSERVGGLAKMDVNAAAADLCEWGETHYGPSWWSSELLNSMVAICSHFNQYWLARALFDAFESRYGCTPYTQTYQVVLRRAAVTCHDFDQVIDLVSRSDRMLQSQYRTNVFYDYLWTIAWRLKLYNVLSVVWTYACLSELTSFKTRIHAAFLMRYPATAFFRIDSGKPRPQGSGRSYRGRWQGNNNRPADEDGGGEGGEGSRMRRFAALPCLVPHELRVAFADEARRDSDAGDNAGATIARLMRNRYAGYRPKMKLYRALFAAYRLDRKLRDALFDEERAGTHVVDVPRPNPTLEIVIEKQRPEFHKEIEPAHGEAPSWPTTAAENNTNNNNTNGHGAGGEQVLTLDAVSAGAVFNYADAFYEDKSMHPVVSMTPTQCTVAWPDDATEARAQALAEPRTRTQKEARLTAAALAAAERDGQATAVGLDEIDDPAKKKVDGEAGAAATPGAQDLQPKRPRPALNKKRADNIRMWMGEYGQVSPPKTAPVTKEKEGKEEKEKEEDADPGSKEDAKPKAVEEVKAEPTADDHWERLEAMSSSRR